MLADDRGFPFPPSFSLSTSRKSLSLSENLYTNIPLYIPHFSAYVGKLMTPEPTHTPEPWSVLPYEKGSPYIRIRSVKLGTRYKIANVLHPYMLEYATPSKLELDQTQKNAERIVACVNACAGIDPESIRDAFDLVQIVNRLNPEDGLSEVDLWNLRETARHILSKSGISAEPEPEMEIPEEDRIMIATMKTDAFKRWLAEEELAKANQTTPA